VIRFAAARCSARAQGRGGSQEEHRQSGGVGKLPLLTREQEITLARQIDASRRRFRKGLLEFGFVLEAAVDMLRRVNARELVFDRTVQVALSDRLEKRQILGRLPLHLKTLTSLLERSRCDYRTACSRSKPRALRRAAWERLVARRRRAVRLDEELGLRKSLDSIGCLQPRRNMGALGNAARFLPFDCWTWFTRIVFAFFKRGFAHEANRYCMSL